MAVDTTVAVYLSVGLSACALAIAVGTFFWQRSRTQTAANERLLRAIMAGQPKAPVAPPAPRAARPASRPSVPEVRLRTAADAELPQLEARLCTAILSADARERLVRDAMRSTRGDRAAAIRQVLRELSDEHRRWS